MFLPGSVAEMAPEPFAVNAGLLLGFLASSAQG